MSTMIFKRELETPMKTQTSALTSLLHSFISGINIRGRNFRAVNFRAIKKPLGLLLVLLLTISNTAQAGDLDDVSIQIIGLDQAPNEALQEIPLPPPASVSITEMQGDVLFNKPMAPMNGINADTSDTITAPVAGGGTAGNGTSGAGGTGP